MWSGDRRQQGQGYDMAVALARARATVAIHGLTFGETDTMIELVRNLAGNSHAAAADSPELASVRSIIKAAIEAIAV